MNEVAYFPIENNEKKEEYKRLVFCEKKSTSRSEFYQKEFHKAGQSGIKASCVLVVNAIDYEDETKVKYKDKVYRIYRTFDRTDEKIELYCEVRAGVN